MSVLDRLGMRPALAFALLAACSGGAPPAGSAEVTAAPPPSSPEPRAAPSASASAAASSGLHRAGPCRVPGPQPSEDACKTDADCGPAEPCHAHACVAAAKARPKQPDTICTQILDCASTDVNRCGCFEGRCALLPPP